MNTFTRTKLNMLEILSSTDLSNTIFSFLSDGLTGDEQIHRTRRVGRGFDSAVRQTRTKLTIYTSDGPFDLCTRWPSVTKLYITGLFIDKNTPPFVFPDPVIFATLFPALKQITIHKAAVDVKSLLTAISAMPGLTFIDFECDWASDYPSDFRIETDDDVNALAHVVQNTTLKQLALTAMALNAQNLTPFTNALVANTSIVDLDLSFSSCRFADIANVLRHNQTICTFTLNFSSMDSVQPLTDLFGQNHNTSIIDLCILGVDVHALTTAMCTNTTVKTLTLGPFGENDPDNYFITVTDFRDINDMIATNSTLTSLTINGSRAHCCEESFETLAQDGGVIDMDGFLTNTTLHTFAFIEFGFDPEFDLIKENICTLVSEAGVVTDLTIDKICHNALGELYHNTTLTSLHLPSENTDADVADLVDLLKSMTSLSNLVISGHFDADDKRELTESLMPCVVRF